jgi:hypothetical protein
VGKSAEQKDEKDRWSQPLKIGTQRVKEPGIEEAV